MWRLDNSLCVSLACWGRVSGRVLPPVLSYTTPTGDTSEEGEKRGHCSLLRNHKRAWSFFLLHHVMRATQWRRAKDVSGLLTSGTNRWAHRNLG